MRKSRLSWSKQIKLMELFVAGSTARAAATEVCINKTSSAYYFYRLRLLIFQNINKKDKFKNEKSVGNAHQNNNDKTVKQGIPIFGLFQHKGKVSTVILSDMLAPIPFIKEPVNLESIVYSDKCHNHDTVDVSEFKYYRIINSLNEANQEHDVSKLDNFWNQAKRHMEAFNGIPKKHFYLYLKECEWQFNYKNNSYKLNQLMQWVKE